MNQVTALTLYCTGTSEGAVKAWDTRGRGRKSVPVHKNENSGRLSYATADIFKKPQASDRLESTIRYVMGTRDGWVSLPTTVKTLPVSLLHPTQNAVHVNGVKRYMHKESKLALPLVLPYKGRYYLMDGHHRVSAAILRGDENVKVAVVVHKEENSK